MTTQIRNIGALIAVLGASANVAVTAAGSGDNTEVVGDILDRAIQGNPQSGVLAIQYTAMLTDGETLAISYDVEKGNTENLSDALLLATGVSQVVATGPAGGGTVRGTFEVDLKLSGAGRYVRANFTPNLSASGADTAALSAVVVFGGADRNPQ